ncbi:MAG: signal peptidase I [Proteobacteria bacterium]|nr:signal peptidase I [Pseudomonadota bacterium]
MKFFRRKEGVPRKPKGAVREYTEAIVIALSVALLLRFFVIEAFKIPSGSMIETLAIGDFIFVNKLSYRSEIPYAFLGKKFPKGGTTLMEWDTPDRGDVVVFRYPHDQKVDYIKRIVALPGDVVEVRAGVLHVNGVEHARTYKREYSYSNQACFDEKVRLYSETNAAGDTYSVLARDGIQSGENFGPVTVRPDHFFAMGDNRDNSSDSRVFGQVPIRYVKGRALFVWLSLDPCGSWLGKIRWNRFFQGIG